MACLEQPVPGRTRLTRPRRRVVRVRVVGVHDRLRPDHVTVLIGPRHRLLHHQAAEVAELRAAAAAAAELAAEVVFAAHSGRRPSPVHASHSRTHVPAQSTLLNLGRLNRVIPEQLLNLFRRELPLPREMNVLDTSLAALIGEPAGRNLETPCHLLDRKVQLLSPHGLDRASVLCVLAGHELLPESTGRRRALVRRQTDDLTCQLGVGGCLQQLSCWFLHSPTSFAE